jgi:septum formation protein
LLFVALALFQFKRLECVMSRFVPRVAFSDIHCVKDSAGESTACHNANMLVLASASPRRRELLAQAGFSFAVHPAHIPEESLGDEDPIAYVTRLAREKAETVFRALTAARTAAREEEPDCRPLAVLGADTTVTLDNAILGKPEDAADAARMLRLLSGRTHRVITGVALVTAKRTEVAAEATAVRFLSLSDEEIAAYVATGEPMDKAGAYAIQGQAARWIPRIEGCYFNVVGLPLALVSALLEDYWPRIDRIQRHGLVDHGCIK